MAGRPSIPLRQRRRRLGSGHVGAENPGQMASPGSGHSDFVGRIPVFMLLESLPVALIVGTVLGFLTGLGVGGGSLLILWLTLALEMPQTAARGINLLFFLPSAMIACYLRWKQGAVTLKKVLPAILTGCAAAAVFCLISTRMDLDILKKLFGVLLLATGIRELCYRPKT